MRLFILSISFLLLSTPALSDDYGEAWSQDYQACYSGTVDLGQSMLDPNVSQSNYNQSLRNFCKTHTDQKHSTTQQTRTLEETQADGGTLGGDEKVKRTRRKSNLSLRECAEAANKDTDACDKYQQNYNACESAYTRAKYACEGQSIAPQVTQGLSLFSQYQNSGDIKAACGKAKELSIISLSANAGFAGTCKITSNSCSTSCSADKDYLTPPGIMAASDMLRACKDYQQRYIAGIGQALSDAGTYLQSKACEDAADAKCVGQNALNDQDCVQFCTQAGRETHPKCALAGSSCQNANFYQSNSQFCLCLQSPLSQGCSTAQFPVARNTNDPLSGLRTSLSDFDTSEENDFLGNTSNGNTAGGTDGGNGGGSGFSGASGSTSPIAADGGSGGAGDDPLNKDILTGSGGSSGGAGNGFFGYGGGGEGSAAGRSGSSVAADGSGGVLDLKAFLPGGRNDPRRAPASDSFESAGITQSDGLTNFQKITRKVNQKLMQGDITP